MEEIYEKIQSDIPKDTYINTEVIQNLELSEIVLKGKEYMVHISFIGFIYCLNSWALEARSATTAYVQKKYGESFFDDYFMYKVINSKLLKFVRTESPEFEYLTLDHYCFITDDDLIDVISSFPPKITVKKLINKYAR